MALALGCNGRAGSDRAYIHPDQTLALPELIERLNASAAQIESLFAAGDFEANLRERRQDPRRFVNGNITVMYLAPDRVRLKGEKPPVDDVFDLGSDGERFWLHLPTERLLYTGTFDGLDPEAARQLPVRPDLVLEVLGLAPQRTDLLEPPVPSLRWNPDQRVYMVTWAEQAAGAPPRWNIVKEVWYDYETLLPKLVILFGPEGDPVLRAYLSRHQPIDGDGPRLATRYDLYFPETGSTMWLDLTRLHYRNPRNTRFPREGSFNPPDPADVPNVVDLDRPPARGTAGAGA